MSNAERNYRLLQEIESNRRFLLQMYAQNPSLLKTAEPRIRDLLQPLEARHVVAQRQRGISLVELIMYIVIVGVAVVGILLVMNVTTRGSADPLIHKQALAIAESLLEEIELMPFTYCDPDDANATTAAAAAGACAAAANEESTVIGPEAGETRYSAATPYDNVSDYNGFGMAAGSILDVTGTNTGLIGYTLQNIAVTPIAFGSITAASGDALQITVTVTGPDGVDVVVEGIRTRYAPNAVP